MKPSDCTESDPRRCVPFGWALALLVMAVTVTFGPSVQYSFVQDDLLHVLGDPLARSISGAWSGFSLPTFPGDLYRPLVRLSFAVTAFFVGTAPMLYHLTNILLHLLVTVLVFVLLQHRLAGGVALAAALLWAVHPIHLETVCSIYGRTELLAALFGLSALWFARPKSSLVGHLCAAGFWLLALLSKESAVVVPLLFVALYGFQYALSCVRSRTVLPYLIAVFVYAGLRMTALAGVEAGATPALDNPLIALSALERAGWGLLILGRYLTLVLFPWPVGGDYSFNQIPVGSSAALMNPELLLGGVLLLFVLLAFGRAALRPWLGWFFGAFLITANIFFPIGTIFAERLLYLPSIGIVTLVVLLLSQLPVKVSRFLLLCSFGALSWLSLETISVWRDNASLYRHQAAVTPQSVKAVTNYAVVLRNEGRFSEAHAAVDLAIERASGLDIPLFVKGTISHASGDFARAEQELRQALAVNPQHEDATFLLAALLYRQEQYPQAAALFSGALAQGMNPHKARKGLLAVALKENRVKDAARLLADLQAESDGAGSSAGIGADPDINRLAEQLHERVSSESSTPALK